jgi:hypothetical protein
MCLDGGRKVNSTQLRDGNRAGRQRLGNAEARKRTGAKEAGRKGSKDSKSA